MTIDLPTLRLVRGAHSAREKDLGVMEAVAWLAGERHTNHPAAASPVIASFCRLVNDVVGDDERQRLVAYVPRLVGTTAPHEVELCRTMIMADWAVRTAAAEALRVAGLGADAERLGQFPAVTDGASARAAAHEALAAAETAMRAAAEAAKAARIAARAAWVSRTADRAQAAERARGVAVVLEAARTSVAEASVAAAESAAAWTATIRAEAAAHAAATAGAAVATWAAAVHAAVQVPVAPIDWSVPLERMLGVS